MAEINLTTIPDHQWPITSARYRLTRAELVQVIQGEPVAVQRDHSAILDRLAIYMRALAVADMLWSRALIEAWLAYDRQGALRAMVAGMEVAVTECLGVDGERFARNLMDRLVRHSNAMRVMTQPQGMATMFTVSLNLMSGSRQLYEEEFRHSRLASAFYHWAWVGVSTIEQARARLIRLCGHLQQHLTNQNEPFPIPYFFELTVGSFNPRALAPRPALQGSADVRHELVSTG